MFQATWTTFKFKRNQLGMVSAFVIISVAWSNQRAHKSLAKNYSLKNFTVGLRTTSKYSKLGSLKIEIVLQISDETSVLLIAAFGFKLNLLRH